MGHQILNNEIFITNNHNFSRWKRNPGNMHFTYQHACHISINPYRLESNYPRERIERQGTIFFRKQILQGRASPRDPSPTVRSSPSLSGRCTRPSKTPLEFIFIFSPRSCSLGFTLRKRLPYRFGASSLGYLALGKLLNSVVTVDSAQERYVRSTNCLDRKMHGRKPIYSSNCRRLLVHLPVGRYVQYMRVAVLRSIATQLLGQSLIHLLMRANQQYNIIKIKAWWCCVCRHVGDSHHMGCCVFKEEEIRDSIHACPWFGKIISMHQHTVTLARKRTNKYRTLPY